MNILYIFNQFHVDEAVTLYKAVLFNTHSKSDLHLPPIAKITSLYMKFFFQKSTTQCVVIF